MEYKKPNLVDAHQLRGPDYQDGCNDLYVHPCFMKAGKHSYLVHEPEHSYYSMHTTICDFRTEDPPKLLKPYKRRHLQRVFRKEHSVFLPWKVDTPESLGAAALMDLDSISTQIQYLIKDHRVRDKVVDYLVQEFQYLKLVFLQAACASNYPYLSWVDILPLAEEIKLLEDGTIKQNNLEVITQSCLHQRSATKDERKSGLIRPEFLELVVRLAKLKFFDTRVADNMADACKMLVENHFRRHFREPQWQTFRDRELWTLDVNDVFAVNLHSLQRLWQHYHKFDKGWMDLQDVTGLCLSQIPDFRIPPKTIRKCFGMSKMTNEKAG